MRQLFKKKIIKEENEIITIAIKDCIHYCGFKYGGQQYNPYETFISRYHNEPLNIDDIKDQFIDFLRYYRPATFNEAFGINLSKEYPLWFFPWNDYGNAKTTNWVDDADNIVDIITHFSEQGIPTYKIDQEFYWMTRALKDMKLSGYQPEKYSYIEVLKFEGNDNNVAYLLLDGNHRVSALHALGEISVKVMNRNSFIVSEKNVNNWINVKNGLFTAADALLLFKNYFEGKVSYKTSARPSPILNYSNNYKKYF